MKTNENRNVERETAAGDTVTDGEKLKKKKSKFLGKYDFKDRKFYDKLGKRVLFFLVVIVQMLMLIEFVELYTVLKNGWLFLWVSSLSAGITFFEWLLLFVLKETKFRAVCYGLLFLFSVGLTAHTGTRYLVLLYMLIVTDVYVRSKKILSSMMSFALVLIIYIPAYGASVFLNIGEELSVFEIISQSFGSLVWLTVHFFTVRFALEFYRQYFRLSDTLKELGESKKQLEKAYDELEKITALTERQRIAKEIHDTAGHSITTVIMQTEAAKLVIDTDKEAAKKNVIAANLQAKHALEELRESVHVLSGVSEREPLKSALQRIIGETVDGTGIRIRSEIEDVSLSEEKYRFVCNTFKEGLSNGIRHGKATAFWFEVKKDGENVSFLLSDNGSGVPVAQLKKGFGLTGMEREAARLGGKLWFDSETDEGFEIHLRLPLD